MTTGAFNDPSGDGNPLGQRLVVLKIRRVVKEIVGTVVHRLPLCRGQLPERGTAPHARRDQTGLPAQNFQQAPSRPAIWFDLLVGEKAPAAFHTYCATWIKSTTMISGMFRSSAICWR